MGCRHSKGRRGSLPSPLAMWAEGCQKPNADWHRTASAPCHLICVDSSVQNRGSGESRRIEYIFHEAIGRRGWTFRDQPTPNAMRYQGHPNVRRTESGPTVCEVVVHFQMRGLTKAWKPSFRRALSCGPSVAT